MSASSGRPSLWFAGGEDKLRASLVNARIERSDRGACDQGLSSGTGKRLRIAAATGRGSAATALAKLAIGRGKSMVAGRVRRRATMRSAAASASIARGMGWVLFAFISVFTKPGCTVVTPTPVAARSRCSAKR